jgi:hypothetical protein
MSVQTTEAELAKRSPAEIAAEILNKEGGMGSVFSVPGNTGDKEEEAEEEEAEEVITDADEGTDDAEGGEVTEETEEEEVSDKPAVHPLLAIRDGGTTVKDIRIPKDVETFFEKQGLGKASEIIKELPRLRTEKQALEAQVQELSNKTSFLSNLSEEALNVIRMDLEKKDWKKEVLSRPSLDFRLTFDKQDKKKLAEQYAKDEPISAEEWEAYENDSDPTTKRLVGAILKTVETAYNADRTAATTYGEKTKAEREAVQQKYTASKQAALDYVKQNVGNGVEAYMEEIEKGIDELETLFYEKDGVTLRPDAGFNVFLLKNKDLLLGAHVEKAKVQAQDQATKDVLRRIPEREVARQVRSANQSKVSKTPKETAEQIIRDEMFAIGGRGKRK